MSEITAHESIKALQHFPACTVMVGQSTMHTTVIASSVFAPNSWGGLLSEGSSSLNGPDHLWNH